MINLKPFCAKGEGAIRAGGKNIGTPFTIGEFSYATDSRVIIRVPKIRTVRERADIPTNVVTLMAEHFQTKGRYRNLPKMPALETEPCPRCGNGKITKLIVGHADIGSQRFANEYLALLAMLPGVKLALAKDWSNPASFKFNGGDGLLMGMRKL